MTYRKDDKNLQVQDHLRTFYLLNGLPPDGGISQSTSVITFKYFSVRLPNPEFRKRIIYLHDLQHILLNKNTTWKGEAYVSGYEISTGIGKQFPIVLYSLWAMGFSLWIYPKAVYNGYCKGFNTTGVFNLSIPKSKVLQITLEELHKISSSKQKRYPQWALIPLFIFWSILSQILFLGPILFILLLIIY